MYARTLTPLYFIRFHSFDRSEYETYIEVYDETQDK